MRMPITDLQLQGRSLNKGPACRAPESGILRQLRLCGPQAAAPDQWLNSRDAQAKPFLGDRRSSNGQFWLEHSPTPLNFPWTAGHSRISAVQSESDWLGGQVKGSSSQPPPPPPPPNTHTLPEPGRDQEPSAPAAPTPWPCLVPSSSQSLRQQPTGQEGSGDAW